MIFHRGRGLRLTAPLLALGLLLLGCCSSQSGGAGACKSLVAGDLVITEIMANPAGDDTGKEWFEVYNTTHLTIDLGGLVLVASKSDATGESTATVKGPLAVAPGDTVVFGGTTADLKPAYVDYGYGSAIDLRNSDGRVALKCGANLVDQATYKTAPDGASLELSGGVTPDALTNDDAANWCTALTEYETGEKGTPGAANETCGGVTTGKCTENGASRAVVAPAVGDLVISELMPDPNGTDGTQEWFELYVTRDVDLNGLQIGTAAGTVKETVSSGACLRATAGSYVLFAQATDAAANGGLPTPFAKFSTTLLNTTGGLFVGYLGAVLDSVTYPKTTAGASLSLDPAKLDPAANDDPAAFCAGVATYGAGGKGTPGAANPSCTPVTPAGKCTDGAAMRDLVAPAVGDLVITELLSDPMGTDTGQEWFEVLVTKDVDLNGLQLGATAPTVGTTLTDPKCLRATAGSYLIFAHNDGVAPNGGLPRMDYLFTFDLVQQNRGIWLGLGGMVLDAITYTTTQAGVARSLSATALDPVANDGETHWCAATAAYGNAGNKGTPGVVNPTCP